MSSKAGLLLAVTFLLQSAVARIDLSGCTSSTAGASLIWYVPDTGEICAPLDCGGGRAPPITTRPGCAQYSGTATYSPSYLPGYGSYPTSAPTEYGVYTTLPGSIISDPPSTLPSSVPQSYDTSLYWVQTTGISQPTDAVILYPTSGYSYDNSLYWVQTTGISQPTDSIILYPTSGYSYPGASGISSALESPTTSVIATQSTSALSPAVGRSSTDATSAAAGTTQTSRTGAGATAASAFTGGASQPSGMARAAGWAFGAAAGIAML